MQQGFYVDPPARRFAWDIDGTKIYYGHGSLEEMPVSHMRYLNSEHETYGASEHPWNVGLPNPRAGWRLVFVFPELRDISQCFLAMHPLQFSSSLTASIAWSPNSTNGDDGEWTSMGNISAPVRPAKPSFRSDLADAYGIRNAQAVKFTFNNGNGESRLNKVHLHGRKSIGVSPHRISFCREDGTEILQDLDYGDQSRGEVRNWSPQKTYNLDSPLYLKNISPSKIARNVSMYVDTLTGNMTNNTLLSSNGEDYLEVLEWEKIEPLRVIGPIHVRHAPDTSEAMGLRSARLILHVDNWY